MDNDAAYTRMWELQQDHEKMINNIGDENDINIHFHYYEPSEECANEEQDSKIYENGASITKILTGDVEIMNADEIVITDTDINVMFSYPFKYTMTKKFISPTEHGFNRQDLVYMICETYRMMYDVENNYHVGVYQEQDDPIIPGTYNREETNGVFGIWGYRLKDLKLEGMSYSHALDIWYLYISS